ncbi:MAG: anti-sigma factor antagonist [Acidobacteria bacterium]|nr:MAG: anti-sigma factor antagonist [Acidobacteriota bacterium]RPJ62699.1 MAG: anti-sigma factor antagonist [Acidobacteriota bacterium]RPJ87067.1 MAG: anti-sigma factor antagonist [Acidobacteriota bacterium]
MSLTIEVWQRDATTKRAVMKGALDTEAQAELKAKLDPILASDVKALILDLAGLSYINSAGLQYLFMARRVMEAKRGCLLLLNVQPQVQKVFDIVKALPAESVFTNVEELDRYLARMQQAKGE